MHFNNNFNGKYWAIFGPNFSGPRGDPDYRGPDYWVIAALRSVHTARVDNEGGKNLFFSHPSPLLPSSTQTQTSSNTWNVTKGYWVQWILRPRGGVWKRLRPSNSWWFVGKLFLKIKSRSMFWRQITWRILHLKNCHSLTAGCQRDFLNFGVHSVTEPQLNFVYLKKKVNTPKRSSMFTNY
jgi:hypothetical protein